MKRVKLLGIILILIISTLIISACTNKKCIVSLVTKNDIVKVEVEKGSVFDYQAIEVDGYVFVGWFDSTGQKANGQFINSNVTFTGKYIKEGTIYKITYETNGGSLPENIIFEYEIGTNFKLPEPFGYGDMTFLGWYLNDSLFENITYETYGNLHLIAKWNDNNTYYNIKYNLNDGILDDGYKTRYIEGMTYLLPIPTKEGYLFDGWYLDSNFTKRIKRITKDDKCDFDIYAKFKKQIREEMNISFLGDSITTFNGYIPDGFATYYPMGDVDSVEKTWWHMVVKKTGYQLLMNNSYSGTLVSGGTNYSNSYERLKYLEKNGIDPDVVVINMGTNDLTRSVNVSKFKSTYISMIDKIREEYDDVEIYILNLPYNKYATSFISPREKYNNALIEIANEKNVELIDITEGIDKNNVHIYMFAGAHPSFAGMSFIADKVWKKIL